MQNRIGHRFQRRIDVPVWLERAQASYVDKVLGIQRDNLIAYWILNEKSGAVADNAEGTAARDGTYLNTPTLNQEGIGDGNGAPLFDPVPFEKVDIYSASLNTAFNRAEGSLSAWGKVRDASVWTDAAFRFIVHIRRDGGNEVGIRRTATNNQLGWFYDAGGASQGLVDVSLNGSTDWFQVGITWSVSADEVKFYLNGGQVGATQNGLGVWVGALAAGQCGIAADGSINQANFDGYAAHVPLWGIALTNDQMASLGTV